VIVIGGGLSGITAALSCARGGATVTLLEQRGRLGGAACSVTRGALRVDKSQHVFLGACTAYRELLADLDAEALITLQPRLEIPILQPGAAPMRLRRRRLSAPLHRDWPGAGYRHLSAADRLGFARALRALCRIDPTDPEADRQSFGEWLAGHRQSSAAVEMLWRLIIRPVLNLDPASATLAQVAKVLQTALLAARSAGDIGYPRVPLSEIHDRAARRALQAAGVDVRLRHGVTQVSRLGTGFCVEVNAVPTIDADVVVLAAPPDQAARLMPTASAVTATQGVHLRRSAIVDVHVVLDRVVLDVSCALGVRSPVQWVFDRTTDSGLRDGQYLVVSLCVADSEAIMSVDDLGDRYLPALRDLVPNMRHAELRDFFVTREPASACGPAPGAGGPPPGAVDGIPGLVLAGSWTDTGWSMTMEGAVRSGQAAATAALAADARHASLGRPAPEVRPAAVLADTGEARV
jgi:squalene-associated FAD-dependent desaturase